MPLKSSRWYARRPQLEPYPSAHGAHELDVETGRRAVAHELERRVGICRKHDQCAGNDGGRHRRILKGAARQIARVHRPRATSGESTEAISKTLSHRSCQLRRRKIRRPLRRDAEAAQQLLQQVLPRFGRDFVEARALRARWNSHSSPVAITSTRPRATASLASQMSPLATRAMSTFGRHRRNMRLERAVRVLELAAEMFAPRRRDLAEHRHRALELAGRHLLEVDLVLLEEPMEVRHRRHDADARRRWRRARRRCGRRPPAIM